MHVPESNKGRIPQSIHKLALRISQIIPNLTMYICMYIYIYVYCIYIYEYISHEMKHNETRFHRSDKNTPFLDSKLLQEPPGPSSGRLATSIPGPEKNIGSCNYGHQHPTSNKSMLLTMSVSICFWGCFSEIVL